MGYTDFSDIAVYRAENGWAAEIRGRQGDTPKSFVAHSLQHLGEILSQELEPQNEIFRLDHLSPEDRERLMRMLQGVTEGGSIRAPGQSV